ncbi:uncharacterized protein [Typha latifolia]|uniref:uncharacterized protein n=1 Tax=Typha latifolia TaxID=4733 RepID=UPI003C300935
MEEAKAAAYYDELTRKGERAARFKQGLGFSSSSSSKTSSSSSPLFSSFIRASSPGKTSELEKQAQLASIQNKLRSKPHKDGSDRDHRHRSEERSSHRHRSRERERRRRSRSDSDEEDRERRRGKGGGERRERDRERERERNSYNRSSRRSNRSPSPSRRASSSSKSKSSRVDYSSLIEGYDRMTPAERVKAKMKLQLSETAAKDTSRGMSAGWERFDFNKDAPLDDDDEIEAADDDASVVKDIGKSFRLSAVEAKHEEELRAAHDEAMFGVSRSSVPEMGSTDDTLTEDHEDNNKRAGEDVHVVSALVSDKVLAMQQGSWRDRARKFRNDGGN